MFVTVNVSFNTYACHEVHFVANFSWARTYVPKSSRHEVTFHPNFNGRIILHKKGRFPLMNKFVKDTSEKKT